LGAVTVSDLPQIVGRGQCIGCGICQIELDRSGEAANVNIAWSDSEEHWVPSISDDDAGRQEKRICPGATMDMVGLAAEVFGRQPADPIVGEFRRISSGHASDDATRRASASGGVTTALLSHLFSSGAIDAAYCTFGRSPNNGEGRIVRSAVELKSAVGSHYHPVNFGRSLRELSESSDRFAFVGLPCEVAAVRELSMARPDIGRRCVLTIGLFCGGINRFSGIGRYVARFGVDPHSIREIDYRDGPWPGQIHARTDRAEYRIPRIFRNTRWNILRYMISFQGYWMLPRCRICPDQIADFADIAVGDPHIPRFKSENSAGHSAIIARTSRGEIMLNSALDAGAIVLGDLSRDELVQSQGYTLENRRQATLYARVARRLGMVPPKIVTYDGLERYRTAHQMVYAYVDLIKVRVRRWSWLRPFYLPLQVFEYLFLTFSIRILTSRVKKLIRGS
jgi:coenzyme F420 hydrogenase subunit beta